MTPRRARRYRRHGSAPAVAALVVLAALADERTRPYVLVLVGVVLVLAVAVPALTRPRVVARTRVRRRRRVAVEGRRPAIPAEIKRAVWARDRGRCVHCGMTDAESRARFGQRLHFDHIWPYSRGGPSTVANLRLLCPPANLAKGNRCDTITPTADRPGRRWRGPMSRAS